jgi:hypothetical protein
MHLCQMNVEGSRAIEKSFFEIALSGVPPALTAPYLPDSNGAERA